MPIPLHDSSGPLSQLERDLEDTPDFLAEGIALEVAEQAARIMHVRRLSRAALAEHMGVSRALVSRTLNAPTNLTLRSLAQLAQGLGVKLVVGLDPGHAIEAHAVWPQSTLWREGTVGAPRIVLTIEPGGSADSATAWTSAPVEPPNSTVSSQATSSGREGERMQEGRVPALASSVSTGKATYALAG